LDQLKNTIARARTLVTSFPVTPTHN